MRWGERSSDDFRATPIWNSPERSAVPRWREPAMMDGVGSGEHYMLISETLSQLKYELPRLIWRIVPSFQVEKRR